MSRSSIAPWVLALALGGCAWTFTPQRAADEPYRSGSQLYYPDGSLRRGLLTEETAIDGVPCSGWAWFHSNGRLESADLAREVELAGHRLPERSRVFFDERGTFTSTFLWCDTRLDGIPCNGGAFKSQTTFHPNGRVRATFLYEDAEIQGVPCAESSRVPVRFDEQGRLIGCKLSRATTIAGKGLPQGATIELDPDGKARVVD